MTDATKVTNVVMAGAREEICLEKDKLESKMNPRFLAEEVGAMGSVEGTESDGLMIL